MIKIKIIPCFILTFLISIFFYISLSAQYKIVDIVDEDGNVIRMKVNIKTGSPHRIYNLKKNFKKYGPISKESIEKNCFKFLKECEYLLKVKAEDLKLIRIGTSGDSTKWYISHQQYYKGIPIYRADVGYTIHENGNVVSMGSDAFPDISLDVSYKIYSEEALNIAKAKFYTLSNVITPDVRKEPELVILPVENKINYDFYLCYNIELEYFGYNGPYSQAYYIDAKNGIIINEYSNIMDGGSEEEKTPQIFYLPQNYPNPFNSVTTIKFYLFKASDVKLSIFNLLGQKVTTLVNGHINEGGKHNVKWDGSRCASGVYICRMEAGGYTISIKLLLIK